MHQVRTIQPIPGSTGESITATPQALIYSCPAALLTSVRGVTVATHVESPPLPHWEGSMSRVWFNQTFSSLAEAIQLIRQGDDERRYRNYDEGSFRSLDDQFYTSGYFNDDRYYDRHSQAINSKGL